MVYLSIILALLVGFILGYFSKGIDINVSNTPKHDEIPENSVNVEGIPEEMRRTVESSNGQFNWGN